MKNLKKYLALTIAVGIIGTASAAFAASPADIVSSITGNSSTEIQTEHNSGKTYGTIAKEAGKLDEFKSQMLTDKKATLDQRVKDGKLTQEQAEEVYNSLKSNQANCDGNGSAKIGQKYKVGFGQGSGNGQGKGLGMKDGSGYGKKMGQGKGLNK